MNRRDLIRRSLLATLGGASLYSQFGNLRVLQAAALDNSAIAKESGRAVGAPLRHNKTRTPSTLWALRSGRATLAPKTASILGSMAHAWESMR